MTVTLPRELYTGEVDAREILPAVQRMERDLRAAAATLGHEEARFLVDAYYSVQEARKAARNQERALTKDAAPHKILTFVAVQMEVVEATIFSVLDKWSDAFSAGEWAKRITGIGPVITAGLLAHIDITRAPTAGHIWRFAGLDPTLRWEKKQRRPWNAALKVLCWKIGESFTKVQNHPEDIYGKVYVERKVWEAARNGMRFIPAADPKAPGKWEPTEQLSAYAEQAARALVEKDYRPGTEARKWLELGKLPPGQIQARAKRYAVKLFLSHYHHVAYEVEYGEPPPKPYVIEHGGHVHFKAPPHWPLE